MNPRIVAVRALQNFCVELTFTDGLCRIVDLGPWVKGHGGVFLPLQEESYFRQVSVDSETRSIAWPNGVDFCPDMLYSLASETKELMSSQTVEA